MRILVAVIFYALAVFVSQGVADRHARAEPSERHKLDPRLQPAFVELLKRQADERRTFYSDQAREKASLKETQAKEKQELLTRHRAARSAFGSEKHTPEERAVFFKSQREEMANMKARQKSERRDIEIDLRKKLADFHAAQKEAERELHSKLLRETSTTQN